MAHVSNALSAQAKRPWALFKYRVKTYKRWGLAWSDSNGVSNQISTFNIIMFAEVLFGHLKKVFYSSLLLCYDAGLCPYVWFW